MQIIKMDTDGRIKLPAEIRNKLNLNGDCEFSLDFGKDGAMVIKKLSCKARFEKWLNNGARDSEEIPHLSL